MTWESTFVAPDGTCHLRDGIPFYSERFEEVMSFHSPGLAAVRKAGEAWHIDSDGQPAYTRRFIRTFGFYDRRAAVLSPDGWHHIHPSGEDSYAIRYAWCGNFQGGQCAVRDADSGYFHILPDGRPAYDARWKYAGDFRYGIAVVQATDGRSTHIDFHGRPVHGMWFLDLDVFHKGLACARDKDGWTHVDRRGLAVYVRRFTSIEPFYNGQARVERFDGALEVIDESGCTVIEIRPPLSLGAVGDAP